MNNFQAHQNMRHVPNPKHLAIALQEHPDGHILEFFLMDGPLDGTLRASSLDTSRDIHQLIFQRCNPELPTVQNGADPFPRR